MEKNGVITFSNWEKGSAVSPYYGFGKLINCDIYSQPGIIKANTPLTTATSINTITGIPTAIYLYGGFIFVGTDAGNLYKDGTLIQSGLTSIHDLIVYKDYLIISTSTFQVHTYGPLSTAPSFHAAVVNLGSNATYGYRKMVLNTTDPVNGVWIANEGYIASISSSFTGIADSGFSATKFTLPVGRIATTICEFGDDLAIMTRFQNTVDTASIIFWDKAQTYGSNIRLSEIVCNQMIAMNNRLYYVGNDTGTLYEANKSSFVEIWAIQDRRSWQTFNNYPNAICVAQKQILFGYTVGQVSYPDPVYYGVYSYTPSIGQVRGGSAIAIRNTISTGNYGLNQNLTIASLAARSQGLYYAGYQDGATVGINVTNISTYATAYIECPILNVGTALNDFTTHKIEINLGENLPVGSSIVLKYRRAKDESFTTVRTFDYSTYGAVSKLTDSFGIIELTTLQIEIDLVPGSGGTPTLLYVVIQ